MQRNNINISVYISTFTILSEFALNLKSLLLIAIGFQLTAFMNFTNGISSLILMN